MSQLNQPPDSLVPEIETATFHTQIPSLSNDQKVRDLIVPVIREELEVHKALHTTATVRIQKIVREMEEAISEPLASETLDIERISINRVVESAPPVRTEGDVTIIPVLEEVLIVTKQLRLVEELHIIRRRSVIEHQQTVTLHAEELIVERQNSKV